MKVIVLQLALIFCWLPWGYAVEKTTDDVFSKWRAWQKCYAYRLPSDVHGDKVVSYWSTVKQKYPEVFPLIKDVGPFLSWLTQGTIQADGKLCNKPLDKHARANIGLFFNLLTRDPARFISLLRRHQFAQNVINEREQLMPFKVVLDKYIALNSLLFAAYDEAAQKEYLFSWANRLFEYCFVDATWPQFESSLYDEAVDPVNRYVYATIWYNLVGDGWHSWSKECLSGLKKCAARGDEIVYIAGGSDIYQLLKQGIYHIRIIDPQLPSQNTYYTNDWEWLIKGSGKHHGIGDCLKMHIGKKHLCMKRVAYSVKGSFSTVLSTGKMVALPKSITTWDVFEHGSKKGRIIFDRRFCCHDDLLPKPHKTLLFSFNEMYYAAIGKTLGGWDVNPHALPPSFLTYVKQLRKPIGKHVFDHMREGDCSRFAFIRLGSVPT